MRKLMWFAIGFAAACVAGVYLVSGLWLFLLALFCFVGVLGLCFLKTIAAKVSIAVLLGMMTGFTWLGGFDYFYLQDARSYDSKVVPLHIEVTDFSYQTDYGVAADGRMQLHGKSYRVRFYLNSPDGLVPGDQVAGNFRLRFTADGGEKAPTYHQGNGVFLLAYERDEATIQKVEHIPKRYFAANFRQQILDMLDAVFPEDTLAFARALLLGDRSLFDYEDDTAFQLSGTSHVVAVSGMHVSILFSLIFLFSGKRRVLTMVLGVPALFLFAALAGFTPSIMRACLMQLLVMLALLLDKEYDPPTALGFAVLVMLVINPMTITSVGFQLSVGCMIGMFLFSERICGYLLDGKRLGLAKGKRLKDKLIRWSVGSVSVTLSAMIMTTPLCAYYFGSVSLVGIIANLLILWVVSFIFYGIMAVCIAGMLWLPLAEGIAWIISWPIRYVLWTADILSSFPLAAVYTNSVYIVAWLVFSYILLVVFLASPKKHPALYGGCITLLLCAAVIASWMEPRMDDYRMTVLDVGQGQCILLQSQGRNYLVDCGGDSETDAADLAAQTLLSQGITRLDGLIVTHYDGDHADGVPLLLNRIPADTLYLPDVHDTGGIKKLLLQNYPESVRLVSQDAVIDYEGTKISIYPGKEGVTDNESSLCVLFQPANCDILITSDRSASGERALLEHTELPKLDVLVAGHHGSKSSTCLEFLQATRPSAAVISVGADNHYGHPSKEVLNLFLLMGCQVFRTDLDGNVVFRG